MKKEERRILFSTKYCILSDLFKCLINAKFKYLFEIAVIISQLRFYTIHKHTPICCRKTNTAYEARLVNEEACVFDLNP